MYSLYQSKAEACLLQLVNIISFSLEEFCQICYCIYFSGFCVSIGNFIVLNEATHSTQGLQFTNWFSDSSPLFWYLNADLENRETRLLKTVLVINLDVKDNHEEAAVGAKLALDLCQRVSNPCQSLNKSDLTSGN